MSDLLAHLFAAKGLARVQAQTELEAGWAAAVGELGARQTKVDGLRRGILSVIVAHPTLLEELASFQKPQLLASLRQTLVGTPIHDIRFKVGLVKPDGPGDSPRTGSPKSPPSKPPSSRPKPGRGNG